MRLGDRLDRAPATYVAAPGDTLQKIARRTLGDESRWRDLWAANRADLPDPRLLVPGQVLALPGRATRTAATPSAPLRAGGSSAAGTFVRAAQAFLGQPFRWGGGHEPRTLKPGPVDGSGLIQQAARAAGFKLDGTAAEQQRLGRAVALDALVPGDLVFAGEPARHVGLSVGHGRVLHASARAGRVVIVPLTPALGFDSARRPL